MIRVFYNTWIAFRETKEAVHNQAGTEGAEVQENVLKTDTTKKLSSMTVHVVARTKRSSETEAHNLLGSMLGRERA